MTATSPCCWKTISRPKDTRSKLCRMERLRAGAAGTVPLQYVSIPRGSDDPSDPNYYARDLSKATIKDISADTTGTTTQIFGPSEAAIIWKVFWIAVPCG